MLSLWSTESTAATEAAETAAEASTTTTSGQEEANDAALGRAAVQQHVHTQVLQ